MYKPQYAGGQILVTFNDARHRHIAPLFAEMLGYVTHELPEGEHAPETYCFVVPWGEEEKAIRRVTRPPYGRFIDWADRHDLRLTQRRRSLSHARKALDDLEPESASFSKDIGKMIRKLEEIKKL
jgi:hypothetical protein